jgi:cell division protein FtsQ
VTVDVQFEAQRIRNRRSARGSSAPGDRERGRKAAVRVALWVAIAILSAAIVGQLVFQFLVSPRVILRRITLTGDAVLTAAEVAEIAGLEDGASLLAVKADRVRALLESSPAVRRASVRRQLPDTLVVDLEARHALLVAFVSVDGATIPLAIDEDGLIFASGPRAVAADVPVISGLAFSKWQPGTRLPAMLHPLLEDLDRLREDEPALYAFISEVVVARAGEGNVEVLVYPATGSTPIRAGGRLTPELLKNAVLFLDVVRRERLEDRVREVDLRAPEVVYTERSGG